MVKYIFLWQFKDELSDGTKKVLGKEIKEKLVDFSCDVTRKNTD